MNICIKGVHRFEPRYDWVSNRSGFDMKGGAFSAEELRKLTHDQIYICDVCTKCGDKVMRGEKG